MPCHHRSPCVALTPPALSAAVQILRKRATLTGTTLRNRSDAYKAALVAAFAANVLPLLTSGALRPVIDREYPLSAIHEAHGYMESNASTGKVVIAVNADA